MKSRLGGHFSYEFMRDRWNTKTGAIFLRWTDRETDRQAHLRTSEIWTLVCVVLNVGVCVHVSWRRIGHRPTELSFKEQPFILVVVLAITIDGFASWDARKCRRQSRHGSVVFISILHRWYGGTVVFPATLLAALFSATNKSTNDTRLTHIGLRTAELKCATRLGFVFVLWAAVWLSTTASCRSCVIQFAYIDLRRRVYTYATYQCTSIYLPTVYSLESTSIYKVITTERSLLASKWLCFYNR